MSQENIELVREVMRLMNQPPSRERDRALLARFAPDVVLDMSRRGHGAASDVEVEQRAAAIWTVRDGRVVRMETDIDPGEALAQVRREP